MEKQRQSFRRSAALNAPDPGGGEEVGITDDRTGL